MTAEELAEPYKIDSNAEYAIEVDGSFQWETAYKNANAGAKFDTGKKHHGHGHGHGDKAKDEAKDKSNADGKAKKGFFGKGKKEPVLPVTDGKTEKGEDEKEKAEDQPFELTDLRLKIPKGSFVAVVGRVGSGKVGLCQTIAEMRC